MFWRLFFNKRQIYVTNYILRREGDSNPRDAFGVYTLSRRAS